MKSPLHFMVLSEALCIAALARPALATPPTKDECLRAHSTGQDEREAGKLLSARGSFATCSNPACPSLIQADCAQFAGELAAAIPSVSFAARDSEANDLPETRVYVDGALVAERLDDGKAYELDPGRHSVRFVHGSGSVTLRVVLNQGERGRNLVASFPGSGRARSTRTASATADRERTSEVTRAHRSAVPLVVAAVGASAAIGGAVLMGLGYARIPDSCSLGSRECAAAPGSNAFKEAHSGVSLMNAGAGTAAAGIVVGVASLIWYLTSGAPERRAGTFRAELAF